MVDIRVCPTCLKVLKGNPNYCLKCSRKFLWLAEWHQTLFFEKKRQFYKKLKNNKKISLTDYKKVMNIISKVEGGNKSTWLNNHQTEIIQKEKEILKERDEYCQRKYGKIFPVSSFYFEKGERK
jgi:hypothetical protein